MKIPPAIWQMGFIRHSELSIPKEIISKAKHLKDSLPVWVKSD